MAQHTVAQGECINSIAHQYGFFWETLWNHPQNAQLKQSRKDPGILLPGDQVFIPERVPKTETRATGQMHRFRLKGVPALCRLQLFEGEEPRANQRYEMIVGGKVLTGTTDAKGVLTQSIPPDAREAQLTVGPDQAQFTIVFGHLDPIGELSGVQARLANLGYPCGASGELDEATRAALQEFQTRFGLKATGELDAATRDRLRSMHDEKSLFPGTPQSEAQPSSRG